jgi:hypothetical protein
MPLAQLGSRKAIEHWRGLFGHSPRVESAISQPGLPVVQRNVAGIDLGSESHLVCAPTVDGGGREVAELGATTPELVRMAKWLGTTREIAGNGE